MIKRILRKFILFLINLIERIEYRKLKLDENDNSKKIINSIPLKDYEILTDDGYKPITHIHLTQPYTIWEVLTEDGFYLECADNHIVFDENFKEVFVKDLKVCSLIKTTKGNSLIKSVIKKTTKVSMFDVSVDSEEHRFYSNGILSHNTIISAIYLVWYLLFNYDRNVLLLANKGATTKEVLDKVKDILSNLPFFLKPGVLKKDVMSMKFDNGCRIIGASTTKTSAIGFAVHLFYADEFAHIPKNILTPLWRSIYPTLSSSKVSQIIITSTPNGFNLFHKIYQNSVDGKNSFQNIFVPWWRVPGRDEKWKQTEIDNLGSEELFNQEYGCQFLAASDLLLSSEELKFLQDSQKPYKYLNIPALDELDVDYNCLRWIEDFNLDDLEDPANFFVLSVDTAEGVGGDYSVINFLQLFLFDYEVLEKKKNYNTINEAVYLKQIGVFSDNRIAPDKLASLLYDICLFVLDQNNIKLVIEANTFGGEVIRNVKNLFEDDNEFDPSSIVKYVHRENSNKKHDGLKLSPHNKISICNEFRKKTKERRIVLTEDKTIEEAMVFAKDKSGSYQASTGNDDKMMTCVNVSTIFNTVEFSDLCESFFESQDSSLIESLENLIDNKRDKLKKSDDDDDYSYLSLLNP